MTNETIWKWKIIQAHAEQIFNRLAIKIKSWEIMLIQYKNYCDNN